MNRGQIPRPRYAPGFPRNIWTVPQGKLAVHNSVEHHRGQLSGEEGFRVWFDDLHENYVERHCGWRPDLGAHYQVRTHFEARKMTRGDHMLTHARNLDRH
jgi:hypothetical protein